MHGQYWRKHFDIFWTKQKFVGGFIIRWKFGVKNVYLFYLKNPLSTNLVSRPHSMESIEPFPVYWYECEGISIKMKSKHVKFINEHGRQ